MLFDGEPAAHFIGRETLSVFAREDVMPKCDKCGKEFFAGDGIWDDDDYVCGECVADQIAEAEKKEKAKVSPPAPEKKKKR